MSKKIARTVADFRAAHDPDVVVPNKIRKALADMVVEGPEHYEYENEFVKRAGVGQQQLATYRDEFVAHIVEAPGRHGRAGRRVWFGSAKAAAKVRGEEK